MRPIRAFVDTSALFAGIWSEEGGGRTVLRLGEAGVVRIVVSRQVLAELDGALRRKAPASLVTFALLLDRIGIEIAPQPPAEIMQACEGLVSHPADARILACAAVSQVEFFITLDRRHFLDNARVSAAVPFQMGTPGDFLSWARVRWTRGS